MELLFGENLLYWIILFVLALAVLIKASDVFTVAAEKIGLAFGMPGFIVGVTIVAIGTSLPELISSIFAVTGGHSEIVIGNVLGSNIANIFLILGFIAIFARKIHIEYNLIHVDLPLLIGSAFLLGLMVMDGKFTLIEGLISLALIVVYTAYAIENGRQQNNRNKEERPKLKPKTYLMLALSIVLIYFGAKFTIDSVVKISEITQIGSEIIAITVIALGTSLPELVVSISAVKRGHPEMAVGNILGSNIFNSLVVMGLPSMFGKLIIPQSILFFSLPVMIVATLLYFFITWDKEITKWEGWLLIAFYVFFIVSVIGG